ncbi:MAG: cation-translocating P-type ATPase [Firmicutes bacterium]|nr:cation-translocating P-type ATPase [Bacillota bacterium]
MSNWFNQEIHEVLKSFKSNHECGLSNSEAKRRLAQAGPNLLAARPQISPLRIFGTQFTNFMVLVLIGAAGVSFALGERADAITIMAIIIINSFLGFIQEYRAEKSLEALKELTAPLANVYRDSRIQRIPASEVIPGDILILESGDRIAADARIIEAVNLEVNEAVLTGESLAVPKHHLVLSANRPALGDQHNMVFAGTVAVNGRGKAVVTATGMNTEIGKIAGLIDNPANEATPLQKRLAGLGRCLVYFCLGICAAVCTLGILRGEPPRQMFLAAVSLAVAAIPEGLPAIVTIALAIGVQKMIRRQAIIRKLPAVETLGCATVICSDKTGTLTQNKIAVTKLWAAPGELDLARESQKRALVFGSLPTPFKVLLEIGILCNNARLQWDKTPAGDEKRPVGDPTEGAILVAAASLGLAPPVSENERSNLRRGELPFSPERKRMGVWVAGPAVTSLLPAMGGAAKTDMPGRQNETWLLVKGASDIILKRCKWILTNTGVVALTQTQRNAISRQVDQWGAEALRVLAFAYRGYTGAIPPDRDDDPETELVFAGLMGMTDPPRPESRGAIEKARRAGIKTKMITGDYPLTAAAIARQIGLLRPQGKMMTGAELEELADEALGRVIDDIDVFARVSPHHKLRIVKSLKRNGEIVAMTGDGVNDAPAVREAHIGVAMGQSGTDVTKEASVMVIADDNYATIVAAVEEGRIIYENIRKSIRYLLSCNTGEILAIFGGILLGFPFPLVPIQILWVNLVTDGLPAIALGMEPAEPGIMDRAPRPSGEGIFSRNLGVKIIFQGVLIGGVTLGIFFLKLQAGSPLVYARTAAFAALVFAQLFFAFQCRSEEGFFMGNRAGNRYLTGAAICSGMMQVLVMTVPGLQGVFYTRSLALQDWLLILILTAVSAICGNLIFRFRQRLLRSFKKHFRILRFRRIG